MSVVHGYAFAGEYFVDEPTTDVLVTPGNFNIGGGFKLDKLKFYRGPVSDEYVLKPGDLIVTMTDLSKASDTLGYGAIVPKNKRVRFLHNQRIGRIVVKARADVDPGFLHWVLRTEEYRHEVLASASGSTVKHTAPSRIEAYCFELPPRGEQEAIAHVLDSIENRMELNRQTGETVEAMACALFKSWFVDFDPVRAKKENRKPECLDAATAALFPDDFVASKLGPIPRGWTCIPLADAALLNPPRELPRGTLAPYVEMASLPIAGHRATNWPLREAGSGARFINGDTLLARITPCLENGKTGYVDFLADGQVGWGSTEYIVLRSRAPLPSEWTYLLARDRQFRDFAAQKMEGSSGRQRVPAEALGRYPVVVPSTPVGEAFQAAVRPWFHAMRARAESSSTLALLRDALLPKLLSGELRVPEAERVVAEAV